MLKRVNDIKELPKDEGLYILNINDKIVKIGKSICLKERITSYIIKHDIAYIICNKTNLRERATLYFIKHILKLTPTYGNEYFTESREILEKILSFFSSVKDELIYNWENEENIEYFKSEIFKNYDLPCEIYEEKHNSKQNINKRKNPIFTCEYCKAEFDLKRNLVRHVKTSKRCLDLRQTFIECIWCKNTFANNNLLTKHICSVDKDSILTKVIREKDIEINALNERINFFKEELRLLKEEHSKEIKEYKDKLFDFLSKKNNKTSTTYNVSLVCDKPLRLDGLLNIMIKDCSPNYIIRGEIGLADWFLDRVCRNENNKLCIECTDKTRKIFKYIDDDNKLRKITGREIIILLTNGFEEFKQSYQWKSFLEIYSNHFDIKEKMFSFLSPSNDFVNYIVDKTHKESPCNLLTISSLD
jgi:hypothetical protein